MLEIIGCIPELHTELLKDVMWLRDLLSSLNQDIRVHAAALYSIFLNWSCTNKEFNDALQFLVKHSGSKNLEAQHGAILGIGYCLERKIMTKRTEINFSSWGILKTGVITIGRSRTSNIQMFCL